MNGLNAYRRSMVAAPPHTLLARLHEQAGIFLENAADFADAGDAESARKHIQYVQDIIAFLRSSLDMEIDVSATVDALYAFYYRVLVNWYVKIDKRPEEYDAMLEFWRSWAATWVATGQSQPSQAL